MYRDQVLARRYAAIAIVVILVIGLFAVWRLDDQTVDRQHYDYWDAYGCHTDGLSYNATADRLSELPGGCKEYHHFIN